jgi:hypothetical protein
MSRPGGRLPSGNIGRFCITQQDAELLAEQCRRAFKNTQLCALKDYSGTLAA